MFHCIYAVNKSLSETGGVKSVLPPSYLFNKKVYKELISNINVVACKFVFFTYLYGCLTIS